MEKNYNSSLLLVIDMQNVYRKGNDWSCESFDRSLENIHRLLGVFPKENVVFTKFAAPESPVGVWNDYNVENKAINESEYLNEIVDSLKLWAVAQNTFVKSTYSSLKSSELLEIVKKYDSIYVTGVVAECCVLSTVFELIDYGKKVYYVRDAVSGENADKENAVITVLKGLSPLHVEFVDSCEI